MGREEEGWIKTPVKAGKPETGQSSVAALSAEDRWILSDRLFVGVPVWTPPVWQVAGLRRPSNDLTATSQG